MEFLNTLKATAVLHPRIGVVLALVVLFLVAGVGEGAAHNPAGNPVPGCAEMADPALHQSGVCHP